VDSSDFVLVQGVRDTRGTLEGWNQHPFKVIGPWVLGSLAIALTLLLGVWGVASLIRPDPTPFVLAGLNTRGSLADVQHILYRNSLVLALHGFACVAGFIAYSSLPIEAEKYSGHWRWIHDHAGPVAIAFVAGATWFSLITQAYVLGDIASTLSNDLQMSPGLLLLGLSLHAIPELTALFLPLAAWIIASQRNQWHDLLAATFVTVALAIPVLVTAAFIEVYVSPHLIIALRG
jgi:hypothetical protein